VLGGHHNCDLLDGALAEQFGRDPQRERCLPEPGVATARKSRGWGARYFTSARRCQPRNGKPSPVSVRTCIDTTPPIARKSVCARDDGGCEM